MLYSTYGVLRYLPNRPVYSLQTCRVCANVIYIDVRVLWCVLYTKQTCEHSCTLVCDYFALLYFVVFVDCTSYEICYVEVVCCTSPCKMSSLVTASDVNCEVVDVRIQVQ